MACGCGEAVWWAGGSAWDLFWQGRGESWRERGSGVGERRGGRGGGGGWVGRRWSVSVARNWGAEEEAAGGGSHGARGAGDGSCSRFLR